MRAAARFVQRLKETVLESGVARLHCKFYGSLAATGIGHATDSAVMLGFTGAQPEQIDPDLIPSLLHEIKSGRLKTPWGKILPFAPEHDLDFSTVQPLPFHPNGMHFHALDANGHILLDELYYSTGGGFITRGEEVTDPSINLLDFPYQFGNARELIQQCTDARISISELVLRNEAIHRDESVTRSQLDAIWQAMQDCVKRGCTQEGKLPGGLNVPRRAKAIHEALRNSPEHALSDPLTILDWVNLYALAVNEENASGGRVVTAPTNGAAGIIPAVLHYATRFRHSPHPDGVHRFLLTAAAIGILYKRNASISGADVGCQGEVGVACSMAAAGLVEYLGGTPQQVENAAEIGMEHNLGLTCDPVGGLVQIPCIERNAMASVKAINAARLAMSGDGTHFISLDKVIDTMRVTGRDMMSKYKETSLGGLAVNHVEC